MARWLHALGSVGPTRMVPVSVRPIRRQVRARSELQVFEICGDAGQRVHVVAKRPRPFDPNADTRTRRPTLLPRTEAADQFRLEVEAASELQQRLQSVPGVRAPAVVAVRTEPATLVLELISGAQPLSRVLMKAAVLPTGRARDAAIRGCAGAGRAVRAIAGHPLTHRPTRGRRPADFVDAARRLSAYLDPAASALPSEAVARVEELLVGAAEWATAPGHADFAPRNVLLDGDEVVILDALFAHNAPAVEDPARFVVNTWAALLELPVGGRAGSRLAGEALDAFLSEAGHELGDPQFRAACIVVAMDRWAAIDSRVGGGLRSRARKSLGLRAMPQLLQKLVE